MEFALGVARPEGQCPVGAGPLSLSGENVPVHQLVGGAQNCGAVDFAIVHCGHNGGFANGVFNCEGFAVTVWNGCNLLCRSALQQAGGGDADGSQYADACVTPMGNECAGRYGTAILRRADHCHFGHSLVAHIPQIHQGSALQSD